MIEYNSNFRDLLKNIGLYAFLIENKCLLRYVYNIGAYYGPRPEMGNPLLRLRDTQFACIVYGYYSIKGNFFAMFPWSGTEEGNAYWKAIYYKWLKYLHEKDRTNGKV